MSADGAIWYCAAFLALFSLYWLGTRLRLSPEDQRLWLVVAAGGLLMNVALLPMYPADAADVYDYIIRGRMTAIYGLNPMHDAPTMSRQDLFYAFASKRDLPSSYGPAWETLAAVAGKFAGTDMTTTVVVFKLQSVATYAVCALLIGLILRIIAPRRALLGVYLFAWNPLVLYMTAGGGHNDTIMVACMLSSLYFLCRRWYFGAMLAATLGALIKFVPLLLVPLILAMALGEMSSSSRQHIRFLVASMVGCGLLVAIFYAPYLTGPQMLFDVTSRTRIFTGSPATLARQVLGPIFDSVAPDDAETPVNDTLLQITSLRLLALFVLVQVIRLCRNHTLRMAVRCSAEVFLFYLVVSATWFQPWYVTWVVAYAALLDNNPLGRAILYFSYFATWQQFLYKVRLLTAGGIVH